MIPFEDAETLARHASPHLHQRVYSEKDHFSRDVSPNLGVN